MNLRRGYKSGIYSRALLWGPRMRGGIGCTVNWWLVTFVFTVCGAWNCSLAWWILIAVRTGGLAAVHSAYQSYHRLMKVLHSLQKIYLTDALLFINFNWVHTTFPQLEFPKNMNKIKYLNISSSWTNIHCSNHYLLVSQYPISTVFLRGDKTLLGGVMTWESGL